MASAEEGFRHRFVAAAGEPGGTEVPPADVHGDGHVLRFGFQGPVDHIHIVIGQFIQVKAPFCISLPFVGVTEFSPAGVIQLQIPATGGVEGADGLLVGQGDVREQPVLVLVLRNGFIVFFPDAANQVEHAGGGNGHLGQGISRRLFQETEMIQERMVPEADGTGDLCRAGLGLSPFEMDGPIFRRDFRDPFQFCQEIQMPVPAAEFSIGDGMEAYFFFFGYQILDGSIFRLFQISSGDFPGGKRLSFFFQGSWTQEAANDIIPERRSIFYTHVTFPPVAFMDCSWEKYTMGVGIWIIPKNNRVP